MQDTAPPVQHAGCASLADGQGRPPACHAKPGDFTLTQGSGMDVPSENGDLSRLIAQSEAKEGATCLAGQPDQEGGGCQAMGRTPCSKSGCAETGCTQSQQAARSTGWVVQGHGVHPMQEEERVCRNRVHPVLPDSPIKRVGGARPQGATPCNMKSRCAKTSCGSAVRVLWSEGLTFYLCLSIVFHFSTLFLVRSTEDPVGSGLFRHDPGSIPQVVMQRC